MSGLHTIKEGHVGVYYYGGALQEGITEPGWNVKLPILTSHSEVKVTIQSDEVKDIPCGTAGGVVIYFSRIQVVNRLSKGHVWETIKHYGAKYDKTWIFDKVEHEINQFCSRHTLQEVYIDLFKTLDDSLKQALQKDCKVYVPGLEIIAVRTTKPTVPY